VSSVGVSNGDEPVGGAWLEQLVAESTGKDGKGVIPIDREARRRTHPWTSWNAPVTRWCALR
jgi:hypothetical protein